MYYADKFIDRPRNHHQIQLSLNYPLKTTFPDLQPS